MINNDVMFLILQYQLNNQKMMEIKLMAYQGTYPRFGFSS